jgi:DNA-binding protein HU-beta
VNKAELIDSIAGRLGDKRSASQAVEAVIDTITRTVARGEKVAITGFGIFEKVERAARVARNPATGAKVRVKKTSVPKFRPGTQLKAVVSGATKLPPVKSAPATKAAPSRGRAAAATKAASGGRKAATAKKASKAAAGRATKKSAAAKRTTKATTARASKATAARGAKKTTSRKTTTRRATKRS